MKKLFILVNLLLLLSFTLSLNEEFCSVTVENKYSFSGTDSMNVSSMSVNSNSEIFISGVNNGQLKVIKLNNNYEKIWSNTYSIGNPIIVMDSIIDNKDNLIVVGGYNNKDGEFVVKINSSGSELWRYALNQYSLNAEYFSSVTVDNENNIYTTGFVLNSSNQHIERMKKLNGNNGSLLCTYNGVIGNSRGERVFYFNNNIYLQSLNNSIPKLKKITKSCSYVSEFTNVQSSYFTQTGFEKDGNFYFGSSNKNMLLNGSTLTNFVDLQGDSQRFFGYSDFNEFIVIAPNYISGSDYLTNKIYFYNFEKQRVGTITDLNTNLFNEYELVVELEKKDNELLALFINGNPLVPKNGGALAKITLNECEIEMFQETCNGIDDDLDGLIDEDEFGLEYGACSVCTIYENKLINPNFEEGTNDNWNDPLPNQYLKRNDSDTVYGGLLNGKRMRGCWSERDGIICGNVGRTGQDVLIESEYFSDIDTQKLNVNYGCYAFTDVSGINKDYLKLSLNFYDESNNLISTDTKVLSDLSKRKSWNMLCEYTQIPVGTRKVNLLAEAFKDDQQNIDVAFDECFVKFIPKTDTCVNSCDDETTEENVCGSAARNYEFSEIEFDGPFCDQGEVLQNPIFPEAGNSVSWECVEFNDSSCRNLDGYQTIARHSYSSSCSSFWSEYSICWNSQFPAYPGVCEFGWEADDKCPGCPDTYNMHYSTGERCNLSGGCLEGTHYSVLETCQSTKDDGGPYCGISNNSEFEEAPIENLCYRGTPSEVKEINNKWVWNCTQIDFDDVSCSADKFYEKINSINYLNADYNSKLNIEISCNSLTNANINLFNSKNEIIILPLDQVVCNTARGISIINIDLNEGVYSLNAQINQPCEVCNKSVTFAVGKPNQQISINDNNILVLLVLISFIVFLIKRERI